MTFWCRRCQSTVAVMVVIWRVSALGKPSAGGQCGQCGDMVLWRTTKVSDAPPEVASEAVAVDGMYRRWQRIKTEERNQYMRDLFLLLGSDPTLIDKLAAAFRIQPSYVRRLLYQLPTGDR